MTPETYAQVLKRIKVTTSTRAADIAECGECGFCWDDSISTMLTPVPAGRCPNEYNHAED